MPLIEQDEVTRGAKSTARWAALLVVLFAIAETRYPIGFGQPLLALLGLVLVLCLTEASGPLLGLKSAPVQEWAYWVRMALYFAMTIVVLLAICVGVWFAAGWTLPDPPRTEPSVSVLIFMCVATPLAEEIIYRALFTVAILPTLGDRGTVVIGGIVFALVHVLNGNPGPDNQIAGFMLEWAFLKSKTILVPLALHAGGNLIALGTHCAAWYLCEEQGLSSFV